MPIKGKYLGCLIGGAVGDALGYPVEFSTYNQILARYGNGGIRDYSLTNGTALISDDTQMTLFTAEGLLMRGEDKLTSIYNCYREWAAMQVEGYPLPEAISRLAKYPELYESREPGRTCMLSLAHNERGSVAQPMNDSKGCGGIMRVAPIGLYYSISKTSTAEISKIAAEAAALTHGHELGYIPAAIFVHMCAVLAQSGGVTIADVLTDAVNTAKMLFGDTENMKCLQNLIEKAVELSKADIPDIDAITRLGEGWVAEETLAIAVYCSLKYSDNFEKAIVASVNHSGDSDSTGAVTGNIMGALLGLFAIPQKYTENLELYDLTKSTADELYRAAYDM